MAWRVWGRSITTTEMTNISVYQKVIPNDNILMLAVRLWVVVYNNPSYTALSLKIYSKSNLNSSPGSLLYTSDNSHLKADVCTLANGVKEVWFHFNNPKGIAMNGSTEYYFALSASGYTGTESSHLAWMNAWPDPVYTTGITTDLESLAVSPKAMYLIGSRL